MKQNKLILIPKGTQVWGSIHCHVLETYEVRTVARETDLAYIYETDSETKMVFKDACTVVQED